MQKYYEMKIEKGIIVSWGKGKKSIEEALTTVIGLKCRHDHQGDSMIYCIRTLRSLNLSMGMGI